MPNHYVFLYPGEKLICLIGEVGEYDHTVIEVEFPTVCGEDGERHVLPQDGKLQASRTRMEFNKCANLTCMGDNLVHAYARERDGDNAWVSAPTTAFISDIDFSAPTHATKSEVRTLVLRPVLRPEDVKF